MSRYIRFTYYYLRLRLSLMSPFRKTDGPLLGLIVTVLLLMGTLLHYLPERAWVLLLSTR